MGDEALSGMDSLDQLLDRLSVSLSEGMKEGDVRPISIHEANGSDGMEDELAKLIGEEEEFVAEMHTPQTSAPAKTGNIQRQSVQYDSEFNNIMSGLADSERSSSNSRASFSRSFDEYDEDDLISIEVPESSMPVHGGAGSKAKINIDDELAQLTLRVNDPTKSRPVSTAVPAARGQVATPSNSASGGSKREKLDDLLSDLLSDLNDNPTFDTQPPKQAQPQQAVVQGKVATPSFSGPYGGQRPQSAQIVNVAQPRQAATPVAVSGAARGPYSATMTMSSEPEPEFEKIEIQPVIQETDTTTYLLPQNELEMEFAVEVIQCRRNPRFYAWILEKNYRPYYTGSVLRVPNRRGMMTREGVMACDDAIRFLNTVPPRRDDIAQNFGMCLAAKEAFEEHAPKGSLAFPNSCAKLREFAKELSNEVTELVGWGGESARELLIYSFLVCDGDPARHNRMILFDERWKLMGVSCGPHKSAYRRMAIANFTIEYVPDLDKMKQRPLFKLIESKLKPEASKLADALAMLQEADFGADDEKYKASQKLRQAAVKVSVATERLVNPGADWS